MVAFRVATLTATATTFPLFPFDPDAGLPDNLVILTRTNLNLVFVTKIRTHFNK